MRHILYYATVTLTCPAYFLGYVWELVSIWFEAGTTAARLKYLGERQKYEQQ